MIVIPIPSTEERLCTTYVAYLRQVLLSALLVEGIAITVQVTVSFIEHCLCARPFTAYASSQNRCTRIAFGVCRIVWDGAKHVYKTGLNGSLLAVNAARPTFCFVCAFLLSVLSLSSVLLDVDRYSRHAFRFETCAALGSSPPGLHQRGSGTWRSGCSACRSGCSRWCRAAPWGWQ